MPSARRVLRKRKAPTAARDASCDSDDGAVEPLNSAATNSPAVLTPPKQPRGSKRPRLPPIDVGIAQLLPGGGPSGPPLADASLAVRSAGVHAVRGLDAEALQRACDDLAARDARLAALIAQHGPPVRLLAKQGDAFASLSKSICFQQLATQAAAKIFGRVLEACKCTEAGLLDHAAVLSTPHEALCAAGLSRMKASYLHDLSRHFADTVLSNDAIRGMDAAELHAALTAVKGLGQWSVDMFAMFHLGLPDVLPVGDLGVRRGMQTLYGFKELPSPAQMEAVAEQWRPWRSVGSYYMWRVEVPSTRKGKKR